MSSDLCDQKSAYKGKHEVYIYELCFVCMAWRETDWNGFFLKLAL